MEKVLSVEQGWHCKSGLSSVVKTLLSRLLKCDQVTGSHSVGGAQAVSCIGPTNHEAGKKNVHSGKKTTDLKTTRNLCKSKQRIYVCLIVHSYFVCYTIYNPLTVSALPVFSQCMEWLMSLSRDVSGVSCSVSLIYFSRLKSIFTTRVYCTVKNKGQVSSWHTVYIICIHFYLCIYSLQTLTQPPDGKRLRGSK